MVEGQANPNVVERPIADDAFDSGELKLGPQEARRLRLPDHPADLNLKTRSGELNVHWNARRLTLGSEMLAAFLIDEARPGELIRFHYENGPLSIEVVPRLSSSVANGWRRPAHAAVEERTKISSSLQRRKQHQRQGQNRFRLLARSDYNWDDEIGIAKDSYNSFIKALDSAAWCDPTVYNLRMQGESLATISGFDELLAADLAKVDQMPHQYNAAQKVLNRMQGRAVLADEVGLGKTIEAGLILKELFVRGLANRFLVLCPAALRDQWRDELTEKFDLPARIITTSNDSFKSDNIIVSTHLAVRNAETLLNEQWDVVIVDEAHRGAGKGTKTLELRQQLGQNARYVLFLTATPVQNSLLDIHRLVENLRPGTFPSEAEFKRRFSHAKSDREPSDPAGLRELLADVMVRTTRGQAGLDRVKRHVQEVRVPLTDQEHQAYNALLALLRETISGAGNHLRQQSWIQRLILSPRALALSLMRSSLFHTEHQQQIEQIAEAAATTTELNSRQKALLELVNEWTSDPGKGQVIVFTQYREAADDLIRIINSSGIEAVPFYGHQTVRLASLQAFRNGTPVMVSTEAGAEGLNLQFANCVINYDLPWNPMKIEQRIGRVDRLTQQRDVYVANFYSPNTVEDHIYRILRDKLRMFELLFGQITLILGEIDDKHGASFEAQIREAIFTKGSVDRSFEKIELITTAARTEADKQIAAQSEISDWMTEWDTSYRKDLSRSGDSTLTPEQVAVSNSRQKEVVSFVLSYLDQLGCTTSHQVEGLIAAELGIEPSFVSVDLPQKLQEEFGHVNRLHIAFHASELHQHPDAELCTAGSDLFYEIMESSRQQGDISIAVPSQTPNPSESLVDADGELEFLGLQTIGPVDWQLQGSWLTKIGGEAGDSKVLKTPQLHTPEYALKVLPPGEAIPETFQPTNQWLAIEKNVLATVKSELTSQRELAVTRQKDRFRSVLQERKALEYELEKQLVLARSEGEKQPIRTRLENVRDLITTMKSPDVPELEARLELLGTQIIGGPELLTRHRWRNRNGDEVTLDVVYSVSSNSVTRIEGFGSDIENLIVAACDQGHVVNLSKRAECAECGVRTCENCGTAQHHDCQICERSVCNRCWRSPGACRACAEPTVPRQNPENGYYEIQLGGDQVLELGKRSAWLNNSPVPGAHLVTPAYAALMKEHGLSPDASLIWQGSSIPRPTSGATVLVSEAHSLKFDIATDAAAHADIDALTALDIAETPELSDSQNEPLLGVIKSLRSALDFPDDALLVKELKVYNYLTVGPDGLTLETLTENELGNTNTSSTPIQLEPCGIDEFDPVAAVATVDNELFIAHLSRKHRSYTLEVTPKDSKVGPYLWFIPADDNVTPQDEHVAVELLNQFSAQSVHYVGLANNLPCPTSPLHSRSATLIDRSCVPYLDVSSREITHSFSIDAVQEVSFPPYDDTELELAPSLFHWARAQDFLRANGSIGLALSLHYSVEETWRGETEATLTYHVEGGNEPVLPDGFPSEDFLVDRSGHFTSISDAIICPVCELHSCQNCERHKSVGTCSSCEQPACGVCTGHERDTGPSSTKRSNTSVLRCGQCEEILCITCSRYEQHTLCDCCQVELCKNCGEDSRCSLCSSLSSITASEAPEWLHASGHNVFAARDSHSCVYFVTGGARFELARTRNNQLINWSEYSGMLEAEWRLIYEAAVDGPVNRLDIAPNSHNPAGFQSPRSEEILLSRESFTTVQPKSSVGTKIGGLVRISGSIGEATSQITRSLPPLSLPPNHLPVVSRPEYLRNLIKPHFVTSKTSCPAIIQQVPEVTLLKITQQGITRDHYVDHKHETALISRFDPVEVNNIPIPLPKDAQLRAWRASSNGYTAYKVKYQSLVYLGLSLYDGNIKWHRVDSSPVTLFQALAGQALDINEPCRVVGLAHAEKLTGLTFKNATVGHREIRHVARRVSNSDFPDLNDPDQQKLADWLILKLPPELDQPPLDYYPNSMTRLLPTVVVDLEVVDTLNYGRLAPRIRYTVKPGQEYAQHIAFDTGRLVNELYIDSEKHLVESYLTCPYCYRNSCQECTVKIISCSLCNQQLCDECCTDLDGVRFCAACTNLTRQGGLANTIRSLTGKNTYIGSDRLHQVTAISTAGRIKLEVSQPHRLKQSFELSQYQQKALQTIINR